MPVACPSRTARANRLHNLESRPCRDTIEILKAEIQKSLEGRKSTIFSADAYYKLLRARRELCKLHGSDLPNAILAKFGTQMEAVTPQAWASAKKRISKEVLGNGNQGSSKKVTYTDVMEVPRETDALADLEGGMIKKASSGPKAAGDRVLPNPPKH